MMNNQVRLDPQAAGVLKLVDSRRRLAGNLGAYLELIQELLTAVSEVKSTKQRAELTELVQRLVENYKELASDIDEAVGTGATSG